MPSEVGGKSCYLLRFVGALLCFVGALFLFVGAFLVLCCCLIVPSEVGGRGFYLLSFVGALLLFDCATKQLEVVVYDHKTAEFSGVKKSVDKRSIFLVV